MFPECLKTGKLENWKIYSGEIPRINFSIFPFLPYLFETDHLVFKSFPKI